LYPAPDIFRLIRSIRQEAEHLEDLQHAIILKWIFRLIRSKRDRETPLGRPTRLDDNIKINFEAIIWDG
jgi:hypothetical protein